jgi:hypothetical protein
MTMPEKDYEGAVTSVAVPFPGPNNKDCFVFGMQSPTYQPPDVPSDNVPVFYVSLDDVYAKNIVELVLAAYQSGAAVQVGLISKDEMQVKWVQLPRAPAA